MNIGPIEHVTFRGAGISGDGDVERVETALGRIEGVRDVQVDADSGAISVSYDPTEVSATKLKDALLTEGYSVDGDEDAGEGLPEGSGAGGGTGDIGGRIDVTDDR